MTGAVKVVNYTEDQAKDLASRYMAGESVDALADAFGKTARSVVAKLSQLGVYKAKAETKTAGSRVTKAEMVAALEVKFEQAKGTFASFEKADKAALEALVKALG